MGLDIYVCWNDMTKEEKEAQITGFVDAPEAGYLRASWPSYSFLRVVAESMGIIMPLAGYHEYGNNENSQLVVTDATMDQLREWRQHWLDAIDKPVPTTETGGEEFFRQKLRNSAAMVDFVEAKFKAGVSGLTIDYR